MNTEEILRFVPSDKKDLARQEIARLQQPAFPFFMRALVFLGAVLAAVFFAGALSELWAKLPFWLTGFVCAAAGWALCRRDHARPNIWARQFGAVLALMGQGLLLTELLHRGCALLWAALLLAAVSYPLFRSFFNRLLCCMVAAGAFCYQVTRWHWGAELVMTASIILFALACGIFLTRKKTFYPLAAALAGASAGCCGWGSGWEHGFSALAAAAAAYVFCLREQFSWKRASLAALITAAGAALSLPCVLGMTLLYVGFVLRERILQYAGGLWLTAGVVMFYYSLEMTLAAKAGLLVLPGLILLWVRKKYAK